MAELIEKNELVRRACAYLEQQLSGKGDQRAASLLDEACMRFNLGPLDAAKLERIFRERLAKK